MITTINVMKRIMTNYNAVINKGIAIYNKSIIDDTRIVIPL